MKVNLIAPVNSVGYGIVSLNILASMCRDGHLPSWWAIGSTEAAESYHHILNESANRTESYDRLAPSLRIWHQFDLAQHVGKGAHCALPIFELDRFTPGEIHHLSQQDILFVPSQWAKEVILANGIKDSTVHCSPFGVDGEIFYPRNTTERYEETRFLNIGKWEVRKGHDALVIAFNKAFTKSDNVRLVMLCHNPCVSPTTSKQYNQQWCDLYKKSPLGEKIYVATERLPSQSHVAEYMASVDCGVFPARAEGWNLELSEMLAMGKLCIATNNTGHTQFANSENCMLVQTPNMESAYDGQWFHGQGRWHVIGNDQIDQMVEYMRAVHRKKQHGDLKINHAGVESMKSLSWSNTVKTITSLLGCQ